MDILATTAFLLTQMTTLTSHAFCVYSSARSVAKTIRLPLSNHSKAFTHTAIGGKKILILNYSAFRRASARMSKLSRSIHSSVALSSSNPASLPIGLDSRAATIFFLTCWTPICFSEGVWSLKGMFTRFRHFFPSWILDRFNHSE